MQILILFTDIKEQWDVVTLGIHLHFIILFAFRQCIFLNNQTKPFKFLLFVLCYIYVSPTFWHYTSTTLFYGYVIMCYVKEGRLALNSTDTYVVFPLMHYALCFAVIFYTRVIFMEDQIPIRSDSSLLFGRPTSKWSLMMWSCVLITLHLVVILSTLSTFISLIFTDIHMKTVLIYS